jgi:hypothetical protein
MSEIGVAIANVRGYTLQSLLLDYHQRRVDRARTFDLTSMAPQPHIFFASGRGCRRSHKDGGLTQASARPYSVRYKHMQSIQCNTKRTIHVHSLTGIRQQSHPGNDRPYIKATWSKVCLSRLAAETARSANKSTASRSNSTVAMHSQTQRFAIGAGYSLCPGSMLK